METVAATRARCAAREPLRRRAAWAWFHRDSKRAAVKVGEGGAGEEGRVEEGRGGGEGLWRMRGREARLGGIAGRPHAPRALPARVRNTLTQCSVGALVIKL